MKICVIGTGYVGLVTGVCLAEIGNRVLCVDKNREKIKSIMAGLNIIDGRNIFDREKLVKLGFNYTGIGY